MNISEFLTEIDVIKCIHKMRSVIANSTCLSTFYQTFKKNFVSKTLWILQLKLRAARQNEFRSIFLTWKFRLKFLVQFFPYTSLYVLLNNFLLTYSRIFSTGLLSRYWLAYQNNKSQKVKIYFEDVMTSCSWGIEESSHEHDRAGVLYEVDYVYGDLAVCGFFVRTGER